jgi:hypothetical protein
VEPSGSNCATGGSKFTAVNGDTYACNGATGEKGSDGAPGQDGAPGADGVSGFEVVESPPVTVQAGGLAIVQATCPAGKAPVQGTITGFPTLGVADVLNQRYDLASGGNFSVVAGNQGQAATTYTARVSCVSV